MTPLEKGAPVARNWHTINALGQEVSALRARLPGGGTGRDARGLHPFQIYTMPAYARDTPSASPADDWRRFRVRAGMVLGTDAEGTDGADWPESSAFPVVPFLSDEVTVASGVAQHWFWLHKDGEVWTVENAANPATSGIWDAYPTPDAENIPIGWVNTDEYEATKQAIIRQLLRADVVTVGGTAGMHFHGEWEADTAYDIGSVVVLTSGTNIGTYVATAAVATTDGPPENGTPWAQLPSFGNGYWV